MILGRIDSTFIPPLWTPAGPIQRVTTFKLLDLHLDASLSWTTHINTILSKASKRLYFLKQLRRAGVPPQQLIHFCMAVIRPVLEYAFPVWHYSITRAQSEHFESTQKRAIHIILMSCTCYVVAFRDNCMKIERSIYCQQQKCSPLTLVSGNTWFMQVLTVIF